MSAEPRVEDREAGITLVEVLLVMVLLAIIGTLVARATLDGHKLVRVTNDQTIGLADMRIASERLGRDVRDARSVLCNPTGTPAALAAADPTCQYHLQVWIDYNADYKQTSDETVTWKLQPGTELNKYDLVRTQGVTSQVQARTVVTQVAFAYDLQPGAAAPPPATPHTTTVNVNMSYDAVLNSGTTTKTVSFSGRLRNVT